MPYDDLKSRLNLRPFAPFRLVLTDGAAYVIRHPELFMLGKRSATIGVTANPDETSYDVTVMVDLLHIIRLESLDSAAAAAS